MPRTILPVKLHEQLTVTVDDIRIDGMGIVNITPTYPLYVADALPGEKITIEVTQVDKFSGYAKVLQRLVASDQRQNSDRQYLIGHLTSGFYRRGTHDLVPMTDYFVNDAKIDQAIVVVRDILEKYQISAFDPDRQTGAIRYIMIRRGYYSHELMVVLVSNDATIPHEADVIAALRAELPELKSLIFNFSPKKDFVLLSPNNRTLWGEDAIHDTLLGYQFVIGPNSFYQVNPQTTEVLYDLAAQKAQLQPTDTVIDAYSGIGTIGITVANRVKQVLGVEVVPGAVADAQHNMRLNGIQNATYLLADAPEQFKIWEAAQLQPEVVFVDPPRRGLTSELIQATVDMGPERLVYISCNPVTLARDAAEIVQKGYQIEGPVQPVDQFPQTSHVESITVFKKNF